jgi:hypothetical protein
MSLNQAQRDAIATTLMQLEQALDEIERLLDGPKSGVTYTTETNFGSVTTQQIRDRCTDIRDCIVDIVAAFELPHHHQDGRRIIAAEMSVAWVNLEEIRPHRLRRYGTVVPTLTETLEPRLDRLAELVRVIQVLASQGE